MKETKEKTLITVVLGVTWLISLTLVFLAANLSNLPDFIPIQGIIVPSSLVVFLIIWVYVIIFRVFSKLEQENNLKQQWRLLWKNNADLSYIIDADGKILEISNSVEKLLDYQPENLVNTNSFDLINTEDQDRVKSVLQQLRDQPSGTIEINFKIRHQDGSDRELNCLASNFLDQPSIQGIIISGKDQTSQHILQAENTRLRKKLKDSKHRYQLLTDNLPIMLWICDSDQKYTFLNSPWRDFMGGIIDQEIDPNWRDRLHPEDLETCLEHYNSAWQNRSFFMMKYRLKRIDGQYPWILEKGVPLFTHEQNFIGYLGICIDITESKNLEEKLTKQLTRYQQALQNSAAFIFSQDVSLRYTLLENFAENLGNYLGKTDLALFPENMANQLMDLKNDVIKTETGIRKEISIENQYWDLNIQPLKNGLGSVVGITGIGYNLTDFHLRELSLQANIDQLENLVKTNQQEIEKLREAETIKQAEIEKLQQSEATKQAEIEKLQQSEVIKQAEIEKLQQSEVIKQTEIEQLKQQYDLIIAEIKDQQPKQDHQQINYLLLDRVYEKLSKPLTTILISTQILANSNYQWLNEKIIRNLNRIENSVNLSFHSLESLKLIYQYQTGNLNLKTETFDLINFCQQTVLEVEKLTDFHGQIKLIGHRDDLSVNLDQKLLKHLLVSLLINSVEYSQEKNHIHLGIISQPEAIIFSIRDQGMGIKSEDLNQIFQPLHRGENLDHIRGMGLGLTVVKYLVELMKGKIILETQLGFGTTFTIQIPLKYVN